MSGAGIGCVNIETLYWTLVQIEAVFVDTRRSLSKYYLGTPYWGLLFYRVCPWREGSLVIKDYVYVFELSLRLNGQEIRSHLQIDAGN
jgi:hypothetical protein